MSVTDSPVDVKALAERLREGVKPTGEDEFATELYDIDDAETVMAQAADALLSAQEEAAGLRVEVRRLEDELAGEKHMRYWANLRAEAAESKLADAVGVMEKIAEIGTRGEMRRDGDAYSDSGWTEIETVSDEAELACAFLTSIRETGDAR